MPAFALDEGHHGAPSSAFWGVAAAWGGGIGEDRGGRIAEIQEAFAAAHLEGKDIIRLGRIAAERQHTHGRLRLQAGAILLVK